MIRHPDLSAFWAVLATSFLPPAAGNSTGLSNTASPSMMFKVVINLSLAATALVANAGDITPRVHSSRDWDVRVRECIKRQSGGVIERGQCQEELVKRLKREQRVLLGQINKLLSRPDAGPTDYRNAAKLVTQAQMSWEQFVRTDCEVIAEVFGQGTDLGATVAACTVDHYKLRNAQLNLLLHDYLRER